MFAFIPAMIWGFIYPSRLQDNQKNRRRDVFRGGENPKSKRWEILRVQNNEAVRRQVPFLHLNLRSCKRFFFLSNYLASWISAPWYVWTRESWCIASWHFRQPSSARLDTWHCDPMLTLRTRRHVNMHFFSACFTYHSAHKYEISKAAFNKY